MPWSEVLEQLRSWVRRDLNRWVDPDVLLRDLESRGTDEEMRHTLHLHTDSHQYTIVAVDYADADRDNYLGAQAKTRTWRPGERHMRGNDLADGTFSKLADGSFDDETWRSILHDILCYELRPPVERQQPVADLPETAEAGV